MSYLSQINGFKDACRPFVGLDGGFMKTKVGGALLSTISRNANNQMYPIIIVVVTKKLKNHGVCSLDACVKHWM